MKRIKICGLTRMEDAMKAHELGAWALGFVFYQQSPRAVTPESVKSIVNNLPEETLCFGVFVNASQNEILQTVTNTGLTGVQLHGDETPEFTRSLREALPQQIKLSKALRPSSLEDLHTFEAFDFCDGIVCESSATEQYGGSGIQGDWTLAAQIAKKYPIILAGGLGPENAESAFQKVAPYAIDLSSSIESAPGVKSHTRLQNLFSGDFLKVTA